MTGAPTPDLDHNGVGSGPECTLEHHPAPCDWEDDRRIGVVCSHYPTDVPAPGPVEPGHVTGEGSQDALQLLQQRFDQLQKEKEDEARRAQLLQISNSNLCQSHA